MTLHILREDALRSEASGLSIRISLPWIRSLPVASLHSITAALDDEPLDGLTVRLGERTLSPADLAQESIWWFVQDRIVLVAPQTVAAGIHRVTVDFRLLIPYLPGGPDTPLTLPFHDERDCALDTRTPSADVSLDAA